MGFKPLAFGLLAGDSPKEALQNAIGGTSIAGKLYMDEQKKRDEEAAKAEAGTQAKAGEGMKKGGKVKGWGMARGARKAKTY
jgi:hypothetical protein